MTTIATPINAAAPAYRRSPVDQQQADRQHRQDRDDDVCGRHEVPAGGFTGDRHVRRGELGRRLKTTATPGWSTPRRQPRPPPWWPSDHDASSCCLLVRDPCGHGPRKRGHRIRDGPILRPQRDRPAIGRSGGVLWIARRYRADLHPMQGPGVRSAYSSGPRREGAPMDLPLRTTVRGISLAIVLAVTALGSPAQARVPSDISIPRPTGANAVGTRAIELVDRSRPMGFVLEGPRRLMVQLHLSDRTPLQVLAGRIRAEGDPPAAAAGVRVPGAGRRRLGHLRRRKDQGRSPRVSDLLSRLRARSLPVRRADQRSRLAGLHRRLRRSHR